MKELDWIMILTTGICPCSDTHIHEQWTLKIVFYALAYKVAHIDTTVLLMEDYRQEN